MESLTQDQRATDSLGHSLIAPGWVVARQRLSLCCIGQGRSPRILKGEKSDTTGQISIT